jgi:uncharacterized protein
MYPRLCKPLQSKSFFLFGARGTGKTKLLESLIGRPGNLWVDLLQSGELLTFSRNTGELEQRINSFKAPPKWIVIDEVQRVPELLNQVHSLIESRGLKFALTGSSARKLKRGSANLLAGRALLNHLFPLTHIELEGDFDLTSALSWGTLPSVVNEADEAVRPEILKTYVEVYLREEIREEQIVRRLDPFARFLEVAAQSSGEIINLSKMGREAGTDAKSIARYFQILEDTLLGFYLEPYHNSIRKRQRALAKFYLFDIGVKRVLEGALRNQPRPQTYEWGKLFEHFLVNEAHRLNSYLRADYRFSYLRTQSQLEVDLILERKGERSWVIEIKSSEPDRTELGKLKSMAQSIPNSRPVVLCNAKNNKLVDGIEVLHWTEGLRRIFDLK